MMPMANEKIIAVADEIRRYLEGHPHASDSIEGVRRWWLRDRESLENVERALELLEQRGSVLKQRLPDGCCIYSGGQPP